jgi:hypothetical protein
LLEHDSLSSARALFPGRGDESAAAITSEEMGLLRDALFVFQVRIPLQFPLSLMPHFMGSRKR